MGESRIITLDVRLDGRRVESETTCAWAGAYVLTIATVLPEQGLAIEVYSTFTGHVGVPTIATHLTLGPVGNCPLAITDQYEHEDVNPNTKPRECAYEHTRVLVEILRGQGYDVGIDIPDDAFEELERVEV